jgi:hypothetical protein
LSQIHDTIVMPGRFEMTLLHFYSMIQCTMLSVSDMHFRIFSIGVWFWLLTAKNDFSSINQHINFVRAGGIDWMEIGREHSDDVGQKSLFMSRLCISRLKIFAAECKICSSERISFVSLISKSIGATHVSSNQILAYLQL